MYEGGAGYSNINTARSFLSSFLEMVGTVNSVNSALVKRFMRGIYNLRPSLPRYSQTWDVSIVLQYLKTLTPVKTISLKLLSWKLVMLLALLTCQRTQTLHLIDVRNIQLTNDKVIIYIGDLLKHSKPGKHCPPIELKAFTQDHTLCIVTTLKEYMSRTSSLRGQGTQLFISTLPPHQCVTKQTISNWITSVLKKSGIDTNCFKPHSTRSAAASAAKTAKIPINVILQTAGWSSESTFQKFYDRQIQNEPTVSTDLLNHFQV